MVVANAATLATEFGAVYDVSQLATFIVKGFSMRGRLIHRYISLKTFGPFEPSESEEAYLEDCFFSM